QTLGHRQRCPGCRPRPADARSGYAVTTQSRAVGLPGEHVGDAVRALLDMLPAAFARLHDPVLRVSGAARCRAVLLPVQIQIGEARFEVVNEFGELRLDA